MISTIRKLLTQGLKKYSGKYGVTIDKIQLVICMVQLADGSADVGYWIYVNYEPKENVGFYEAVAEENKKIHFIAYDELTRNFILGKAQGYLVVDNIDPKNLFFIVYQTDEIMIRVMNGQEQIEQINLLQLFS